MPIAVDIDVMLARRKMSVGELADRVGITPANLAVLKNGRAKAVRFATLAALCKVLECQPGDVLRWEAERRRGRMTCPMGGHPRRLLGRSRACRPCRAPCPCRQVPDRAPPPVVAADLESHLHDTARVICDSAVLADAAHR